MDVYKHLERIKGAKNKVYKYNNAVIELEEEGHILLEENIQFLFNCSWLRSDPFTSVMVIRSGAQLVVKNNFKIFSGARVFINKNASLILGSGYINNNLTLHCFKEIEIGEDVAISDNVSIRDSDNHMVMSNPHFEMTIPVRIGNHVWIGMNVTILKGVTIGNGAIIAAGSVVTRNVPERCLAAGVPARVLKEGVEWQ